MNIFILDNDPQLAAGYHCDQHLGKMIIESAQLLSTECRRLGVKDDNLYQSTHVNHPCAVWLRDSFDRCSWLWRLTVYLDYNFRLVYGKNHKSSGIATYASCRLDKVYNKQYAESCKNRYVPEDVALAMPDGFKTPDHVEAYRDYYVAKHKQWEVDKGKGMTYTKRPVPEWFLEMQQTRSY